MAMRVLSALGLLLALGVAVAAGGAPREERVPDLIGLKRSHAESRIARHHLRDLLATPFAARYEAGGGRPTR